MRYFAGVTIFPDLTWSPLPIAKITYLEDCLKIFFFLPSELLRPCDFSTQSDALSYHGARNNG